MVQKNPKTFLGLEVENKINLGDILTILGILGTIVVVSIGIWRELYDRTYSNDKRLTVMEQEMVLMKRQADRDRSDIKDDLSDIKIGIRDLRSAIEKKEDKRNDN